MGKWLCAVWVLLCLVLSLVSSRRLTLKTQSKSNVEAGRSCQNIYPDGKILTDCTTVESARCYCQNCLADWGTTYSNAAATPPKGIKYLTDSANVASPSKSESGHVVPADVSHCPTFDGVSTLAKSCYTLCPVVMRATADFLKRGCPGGWTWPQCITPDWTTKLQNSLGVEALKRYSFTNKEIDGICSYFIARSINDTISTLPKLDDISVKVTFTVNTGNFDAGKKKDNDHAIKDVNDKIEKFRDAINAHIAENPFLKSDYKLEDANKPTIYIMGVANVPKTDDAGKLASKRIVTFKAKLVTTYDNMKFKFLCYKGKDFGIYVSSSCSIPPGSSPQLVDCVPHQF